MNRTLSKGSLHGIYVPLVTPMRYGRFDPKSMAKLINFIEPFVDGFIPCLSTGEGQDLSQKQWVDVVSSVRSLTKKPVLAGIKRGFVGETILLARQARRLGCDAVVIPVSSQLNRIVEQINLPVVLYNTNMLVRRILTSKNLLKLDKSEKIIAIKDSSLDRRFFTEICKLRLNGRLGMSVFQGMEHQLNVPAGCDGFMVSLANVEPELVRSMQENRSPVTNKRILRKFMEYNLGGEWYVSLKTLLFSKGLIHSAEQVKQSVLLDRKALTK